MNNYIKTWIGILLESITDNSQTYELYDRMYDYFGSDQEINVDVNDKGKIEIYFNVNEFELKKLIREVGSILDSFNKDNNTYYKFSVKKNKNVITIYDGKIVNEYEHVWLDNGSDGPGYYDDEGNYVGKHSSWNSTHGRDWYGRSGSHSHRDYSHADYTSGRKRPQEIAFVKKYGDRFVVVNSQGKYLYITKTKSGDTPNGYMWTPSIEYTVPFKTEEKARSFIRLFANLPLVDMLSKPKTGSEAKVLSDDIKTIKSVLSIYS